MKFYMVPVEAVTTLPPLPALVLGLFNSFWAQNRTPRIDYQQLEKRFGITRRHARRVVQTLVETGYLHIEKQSKLLLAKQGFRLTYMSQKSDITLPDRGASEIVAKCTETITESGDGTEHAILYNYKSNYRGYSYNTPDNVCRSVVSPDLPRPATSIPVVAFPSPCFPLPAAGRPTKKTERSIYGDFGPSDFFSDEEELKMQVEGNFADMVKRNLQEDGDWKKKNAYMMAGRRPMVRWPDLWLTPQELHAVFEYLDDHIVDTKWSRIFAAAQAEALTQKLKGKDPSTLNAFRYLTTFATSGAMDLEIKKNIQERQKR